MKAKLFYSSFIFMMLFSSCQKEISQNSSAVNFQLQSQNATAGLVQWTSGNANATSLIITASQTTTVDYSSTIKQNANLISSTALGQVILPVGTYSNPVFRIVLQSSGTASALHLEGNFNDGSTNVPVILDVTDQTELKASKNEISTNAGGNYNAVISLDLSAMLQGIALSDLIAAENGGEVLISPASNATLYNAIISNLAGATSVDVQ